MATTTLPAPTASTAGIAGDPAALYAAADAMTATAKAYFNAADAIAAHGRAVTANWYGDASDAAGRHIQTLSTRVQVGFDVYTKAADAVRTYAGELAGAQDAWNTAATRATRATTAATALTQAHQQASTAAAMPTTDSTGKPDPTAQAAQTQAAHDADTAINGASTAVDGAHQDMATAVANAAAANQRAADAITTCCDQLTAMGGEASTTATASTGGTGTNAAYTGTTAYTAHPTPPKHHQSAWDGAIDWAKGAENWLEDNSGTIADVLGTAALISAFIPGVDLAVTPILGALSASAGLMAAHHAYAEGDKAEGDQQILMAGLSILPDGRMLGEGLQAVKGLKEADDVADAAHATENVRVAARGSGGADAPKNELAIPSMPGDPGHLDLKYKSDWDAETRAIADEKVEALRAVIDDGKAIKTSVTRSSSAATVFKKAGGSVPAGHDVDHTHDLQLGGTDELFNMNPLLQTVNRSLGAQIGGKLRNMPVGTPVTGISIE